MKYVRLHTMFPIEFFLMLIGLSVASEIFRVAHYATHQISLIIGRFVGDKINMLVTCYVMHQILLMTNELE